MMKWSNVQNVDASLQAMTKSLATCCQHMSPCRNKSCKNGRLVSVTLAYSFVARRFGHILCRLQVLLLAWTEIGGPLPQGFVQLLNALRIPSHIFISRKLTETVKLTACSFLNMNKKCCNCHRCKSCQAETFWCLSHEQFMSHVLPPFFTTTGTGLWPRHPLWTPKFSSEVQDLLVWRLGGFHLVEV